LAVPSYGSNAELLAALRALIDRWCDRRSLRALHRVLPGYLGLNGMNDGWGELRNALVQVRAFAREELTDAELAQVSEMIAAIDRVLAKR
jgi:hypothetical protein